MLLRQPPDYAGGEAVNGAAVTPSPYLRGVVVQRHDLTPTLWTIRVRTDEELRFTPGQYVALGLPLGTRIIERPYSLLSAPHEAELEFFIELVAGGKLTPLLYQVGVGGEILVRRNAKGRFGFDAASRHAKHLMIATVTGAAPFVSILRDMTHRGEGPGVAGAILLLQGAAEAAEFGYSAELSQLGREGRWFRYVPTVSRVWLDPGWQGEVGRVDDIVRKYADACNFGGDSCTAYLCGHPQMIVNVRETLLRARFRREFIREEMYWPAP